MLVVGGCWFIMFNRRGCLMHRSNQIKSKPKSNQFDNYTSEWLERTHHRRSNTQYNTIQYNTIQYNTIQYNTIQYNTIQYNTIQYNTIQYSSVQPFLSMLSTTLPNENSISFGLIKNRRYWSFLLHIKACWINLSVMRFGNWLWFH